MRIQPSWTRFKAIAAREGAALSLLTAAGIVMVGATAHADVTPNAVNLGPFQVDSAFGPVIVEKTLFVPDVPPKLDVCLVVDLSGSYVDDLDNLKTTGGGLAEAIFDGVRAVVADSQFGLATFIDFPFDPWGVAGDYAYQLETAMTPTKATFLNAVDALVIGNGNDVPESQYEAVVQAATGVGRDVTPAGPSAGDIGASFDCGFREDAFKVIALTTDAPFHNPGDAGPFPYPGPSQADAIAAMDGEGIVFVGLAAPGSSTELQDLADATGGAVQPTTADSGDIVDAILLALGAVLVTLDASVDPGTDICSISVGFNPAFPTDVDPPEAGLDYEFDEDISGTAPSTVGNGQLCATVTFTGNDATLGVQTITVDTFDADWDVKFCSNPNAWNSKRHTGVMPFTVFTEGINASQIDVATLEICEASTDTCSDDGFSHAALEDRGQTSDIGAAQCAIIEGVEQDFLNPDGRDDLEVAWSAWDVNELIDATVGPVSKGDTVDLYLKGTLLDGVTTFQTSVQTLLIQQ